MKGAYWDEEQIVADQNNWPVPVFDEKHDTDESFERCTDALLEAWPHLRPAFGTHNPYSIAQAIVKAKAAGLPDDGIEFQTLYGMAEGLRGAVSDMGYRTRVYVPVGQVIPGMAYLVRRLLENTSNQAWFNTGTSATQPAPADTGSLQRHDGREPADATGLLHIRNSPPAPFFEADARDAMQEAIAQRRERFGADYPLLIG